MKSQRAIPIALAVALVIGGAFWIARESRARECRAAAATLSAPVHGFGADIDAALALARELNAETARQCYRDGYLSSPRG